MNANDYREKLEKAQNTVNKKRKTLEKYYKKKDKIEKTILERGWDFSEGRYQKENTPEHHDCYWTFCDLDDALEGIERTKEAIEEKEKIVRKWEGKLQEAIKKEDLIANSVPKVLKDFQKDVIERWDKWDLETQNTYKKKYDKIGYKEFIKKYKYPAYKFLHATEEEIHKENVKASERLMLNLWNRVREIVGEVTDWAGLHLTYGNEWEGCVVNGVVIGVDGKASVETIGAGGYNIQKFHYRTLVHKL